MTKDKETKEAPERAKPKKREAKPPKPKKEKLPELEQRNGVTRPRPKAEGSTARVWEIADGISAKESRPAQRGEVLEAGEALGINPATISTQYARWRKFYGIEGRQPKEEAEAETEDDVENDVEEEVQTAAE